MNVREQQFETEAAEPSAGVDARSRDYNSDHYKERKPPKNINSFHCATREHNVQVHLDKWKRITNEFEV